jgi:MerR family transcriptional regulator, light-induced transcriptional regulator
MPASNASTSVTEVDELRLDELRLDARSAPAARILARAGTMLDSAAMVGVLSGSILGMGVIATWERVACPVLRALEQLPLDTGQQIAVERMLSRAVSEAFASVLRPEPGVPVRVLLACADDEQHTLALQAFAAAVAEFGMSSCFLGAGMPPRALHSAVRQVRPAVAVVWSQTAATADRAQLLPLLIDRPCRTLVAAGPGWAAVALPDSVVRPTNLSEAVSMILPLITPNAGLRSPKR